MIRLDDRVILVTGASSGIGRAVATEIAKAGGKPALLGRNEERLYQVVAETGGKGVPFAMDLASDEAKIESLVDEIREEMGPIWGLVHAAGHHLLSPLRSFEEKTFLDLFKINLAVFFELSKEVCKKKNMDPCGGSIIAIASMAAVTGDNGLSQYGAIKGGLISAVRSLALEFAPRKIRFNSISPAMVQTPMFQELSRYYPDQESFLQAFEKKHPLGLGNPEDIAGPAVFLLSDLASWITGTNLIVDGGYSLG